MNVPPVIDFGNSNITGTKEAPVFSATGASMRFTTRCERDRLSRLLVSQAGTPGFAMFYGFRGWEILSTKPLVGLSLGFFGCNAVALLQFAYKLIPLPCDLIQIVVSEFAPFFFDRPTYLFPLTFDLVPIHVVSPYRQDDCCRYELSKTVAKQAAAPRLYGGLTEPVAQCIPVYGDAFSRVL
jgi:hypothetical protein